MMKIALRLQGYLKVVALRRGRKPLRPLSLPETAPSAREATWGAGGE
jgi:hypothetical protein